MNPSLKDIGILAAIVILRTVLNFFLQRELAEAQRREGGAGMQIGREALGVPVAADTEVERQARAVST